MTPEERELNELLKIYLPDRYWQQVRKKLIPPLIAWKKQRKPKVKKEFPPHGCVYKEGNDSKFRCSICGELMSKWWASELKKK